MEIDISDSGISAQASYLAIGLILALFAKLKLSTIYMSTLNKSNIDTITSIPELIPGTTQVRSEEVIL